MSEKFIYSEGRLLGSLESVLSKTTFLLRNVENQRKFFIYFVYIFDNKTKTNNKINITQCNTIYKIIKVSDCELIVSVL